MNRLCTGRLCSGSHNFEEMDEDIPIMCGLCVDKAAELQEEKQPYRYTAARTWRRPILVGLFLGSFYFTLGILATFFFTWNLTNVSTDGTLAGLALTSFTIVLTTRLWGICIWPEEWSYSSEGVRYYVRANERGTEFLSRRCEVV